MTKVNRIVDAAESLVIGCLSSVVFMDRVHCCAHTLDNARSWKKSSSSFNHRQQVRTFISMHLPYPNALSNVRRLRLDISGRLVAAQLSTGPGLTPATLMSRGGVRRSSDQL